MIKKKKYLRVIIAVFLVSLTFLWFYMGRDMGNPRENFDGFFKVFKEKYALFDVKKIDWNKIYDHYSKRVSKNTSDDTLFNIFHEVLNKLDDKHCYIYKFNRIYFSGFGLPPLNYYSLLSFDFRDPIGDFSSKLIKKQYLQEGYEESAKIYSLLPPFGIRNIFTTGWLSDSVVYIHMTEMSNRTEKVDKAISDFFGKYGSADGFVIDVRDNIGGYSTPVRKIAERFSDKERVFAISRLRDPGDVNLFMEPEYWAIGPALEGEFINKPVVVLTNGNTQSAAELFVLMMKTIPDVVTIGTPTAGIFADTHIGKLPNGWEYRLSVRKTNDSEDISFEGKGLMPDIVIVNTKKDISRGKDKVLEKAIKYLLSKTKDGQRGQN